MKKIFFLIFFLFFNHFFYSSCTPNFYEKEQQVNFLKFMKSCCNGLYPKAVITVSQNENNRFSVNFSAQNSENVYMVKESETSLPFEGKEKKHLSDLITSFIATESSSTSEALTFITILMGTRTGQIEFNKKSFSIK